MDSNICTFLALWVEYTYSLYSTYSRLAVRNIIALISIRWNEIKKYSDVLLKSNQIEQDRVEYESISFYEIPVFWMSMAIDYQIGQIIDENESIKWFCSFYKSCFKNSNFDEKKWKDRFQSVKKWSWATWTINYQLRCKQVREILSKCRHGGRDKLSHRRVRNGETYR